MTEMKEVCFRSEKRNLRYLSIFQNEERVKEMKDVF